MAQEVRRSGLSEEEWLARGYPRIRQLLDSGEYPIFSKMVNQARGPHLSPDERFRYGLERVLDRIAAGLPAPAGPSTDDRENGPR
ncbi:TetR/AcrR family transcriptional regulator C-terminal domain-containing protein [Spongiactinospora sp. 9N601]|uniref:TetR/AcrR family transcriptional regulator C-terminal domain-containing protein n=1 Tax=Spongiactinospora sp. 9N601 TaxID=3375149 RepID=UPI0037BAF326